LHQAAGDDKKDKDATTSSNKDGKKNILALFIT